jgi:hypothetical protein
MEPVRKVKIVAVALSATSLAVVMSIFGFLVSLNRDASDQLAASSDALVKAREQSQAERAAWEDERQKLEADIAVAQIKEELEAKQFQTLSRVCIRCADLLAKCEGIPPREDE